MERLVHPEENEIDTEVDRAEPKQEDENVGHGGKDVEAVLNRRNWRLNRCRFQEVQVQICSRVHVKVKRKSDSKGSSRPVVAVSQNKPTANFNT